MGSIDQSIKDSSQQERKKSGQSFQRISPTNETKAQVLEVEDIVDGTGKVLLQQPVYDHMINVKILVLFTIVIFHSLQGMRAQSSFK